MKYTVYYDWINLVSQAANKRSIDIDAPSPEAAQAMAKELLEGRAREAYVTFGASWKATVTRAEVAQ